MHAVGRFSFARRISWFALLVACAAGVVANLTSNSVAAPDSAKLELKKGDHIAIIGNTLADRMQHDAWLETYLQARHSDRELVIRNLGFSGDEVDQRLRSAGFGSPEDHLKRVEADVVFAFFGYNESYAGEAGLEAFKNKYENFVKQTLAAKYNGESEARLVLFSPIAFEDHKSKDLPSGEEHNRRLKAYTAAMAAIASTHKTPFVDLFAITSQLYEQHDKLLTINGVHLNELGNKLVAEQIVNTLFGKGQTKGDLEPLRKAIQDKNLHWFNRYRTTDGFSIFGGRADLKFTAGQTNRVVAQRELEILDAMTANRDKRIWAVAQGKDAKVDDSNTPEFIPVVTNKPGPLPGGKHAFLGGEEAITKMTVAKNMKVNLFASEEQFPELINPVQMAFDPQGRLWVAAWESYPHWKPKDQMADKLLILEDTNGDGKADKCTTFAGDLHNPTGFEFWNGGVLVAMAPDVLFLKDTDGDSKADLRERVLSGIDSADTHHTSNSFTFDPGGALYFQEGTFHQSQIESPYRPTLRLSNAGVFRYEPRTHKVDVYVSFGFANPHGHVFDRWGRDIVIDGTGANPFHGALFSGDVEYPNKHGRPPQVYKQRTRPCSGMEILSSSHFPEENRGNLLVLNVIGFQGMLQYKVEEKGASLTAKEVEPIVSSSDPNFRPADVEVGPDGAIYFTDWHNPIIGHMQHNLRDPSRDREHGRVYRVTYEGRELTKPAKIAGEPIEKLLDLLKDKDDRVRYRTRIELSSRKRDEVLAAAEKWAANLLKTDGDYDHHLTEVLWLHQANNTVNEELLKKQLRSPEAAARAAATRVLCVWRDRVPQPLELLRTQVNDESPAVRLEAVRALSFFTGEQAEKAAEVAVESLAYDQDEYLKFTLEETNKTLDRRIKAAKKK